MSAHRGLASVPKMIAIVAAIVLIIGVALLFASQNFETSSTPTNISSSQSTSSVPSSSSTRTSETSTVTVTSSSTSEFNETLGLRLDLGLSMFSNGTLNISADEFNPSNSPENVTAADNWPLPRDVLDPYYPCDIPEPLGLTLFGGSYGSNNFTSATPLALYNTSVVVGCTINAPATYFSFRPTSNIATEFYSNIPGDTGTLYNGRILLSVSSLGYWTDTFHVFSSNQSYTIMAGDEWGRAVFLQFRPLAPLTTSEVSSSLCSSYGSDTSTGIVYLRVAWPEAMNDTFSVQISRTGPSTDQFYCPGVSLNLGNFSNPMQFREVSSGGDLPPWGCYDVVIRTLQGTPLISASGGFCVQEFTGSAYVTILMPEFNVTTMICPPGASCAAPGL